MVYVVALSVNLGDEMYPLKKAKIAHLQANEALIKVFNKYADFADLFLPKLAAKFSKHMRIKIYAIELLDDQQPPYNSIYSLQLMELKIWKVYIKNSLTNSFIKPFKSLARVLIFFNKKSDSSLRLYMDY